MDIIACRPSNGIPTDIFHGCNNCLSPMSVEIRAIELHERLKGKIEIRPRIKATAENMSLIYTPGVAEASRQIHKNPEKAYHLTSKWNTIAIVCDGTRVLGLGDIGPMGALAVMEGKSLLFRHFAGVNAVPLCIEKSRAAEIIDFVKRAAPTFGGINIEDIESPKCFEVERTLSRELEMPVFHDDQNGTAIVVLAALINSMEITGKKIRDSKIMIAGCGAAGVGIASILHKYGAKRVYVTDSKGVIGLKRKDLNPYKREIAAITNMEGVEGDFEDILDGSDVLIGVTGIKNSVTKAHVRGMARNPVVFSLTNPDPEITPEDAFAAGAKVVGTGRSDYPNQINNSLVFPGLFRGALDVRAKGLDHRVYIAAAEALASLVDEKEREKGIIIPHIMDRRVAPAIADAVKGACIRHGLTAKGSKR